jgi:hypothetical protein
MASEFRPPFNWRDHLKVHPAAADLFPLMSEAELKELAEDIRKNGLQQAIVIWRDNNTRPFKDYLIDGHNRLDALAMLGWLGPKRGRLRREPDLDYEHALPLIITRPEDVPANSDKGFLVRYDLEDDDDVRKCVVALNLHRRHLTAEQKRDVIAKLLKANPESSNLQIAKQVKADDKTVAKVRHELESRSDIPNVEIRTDSKGRNQPSRKPERDKQPHTPPPCDGAEASAKARKPHYAAPAPEQTAEPQASDAANKLILKTRVTKMELLRMLEPILALAFKDDEGQELVATISDGDAVVYDALECAGGIIDELRAALLETNDSTEADQDDGATIDSKGIFLALAANAADKPRIALRNIRGEEFSPEDKEKMAAAADHAIRKWEGTKRKIRVKEAKDEGCRNADATAPPIHDDLSIPEFLRRKKDDIAGKAVA